MTCKVSSKTEDGLPYPEVTWQYPARLRDYVEVQTGDTFVHTDYVNSVSQSKYTDSNYVNSALLKYFCWSCNFSYLVFHLQYQSTELILNVYLANVILH